MSHQRAPSNLDGQKEPHSVSLKVLRLSRPSMTLQNLLPRHTSDELPVLLPSAGLSYPSADADDQFILSPLLTLPPAFGSAYVGETFSCTLCANNELPQNDQRRVVNSVRISAEMQTPSQTLPLDLTPEDGDLKGAKLEPTQSLQKIVRYDLKEEGSHVLAVTVTYSETAMLGDGASPAQGQAASGRVRTFRKLYQFLAQQCLAVRTKAGALPRGGVDTTLPDAKEGRFRFMLEAQLENMGEEAITLETVSLQPKPPLRSTSLNWDLPTSSEKGGSPSPVVNPRDIMQVAFLIEQERDTTEGLDGLSNDMARDGRATLGQLSIAWRSGVGNRGFLSTGWLTSRRR
ncbi:MAG: hypothetical protein M1832_000039 [Thelocarpon impressellum]|nr:MAG: hypothetical protein M1832_000039 [Thelocarpon impressellum]